jgi:hypothetical protein
MADAKEISDKLRQTNIANIAKKLNAGKTLTKTEQTALDSYDAINGVRRRLGKKELAQELGISRPTLDEYLDQEGAPKPDENGTYSVEDAGLWVANNSVTAGSSKEMRRLREALMRIRVEAEEIDLAKNRGKLVDKATIEPQLAVATTTIVSELQKVFEDELPSKTFGKTVVEIREINAAGVDRVVQSWKDALAPISR